LVDWDIETVGTGVFVVGCLRHWDKEFYWLIDWDIETVGTGVFGGWLFETLRHAFLSFSGLGPVAFGAGVLFCPCSERDEVYDECEAKIGCFMRSIAGWLVDVKGMEGEIHL
jgi:hypothetical protein